MRILSRRKQMWVFYVGNDKDGEKIIQEKKCIIPSRTNIWKVMELWMRLGKDPYDKTNFEVTSIGYKLKD